jgi:enoyl-CoA hydratase
VSWARDSKRIIEVNRGCFDHVSRRSTTCAVPVIAAVHGFCLGGGIGMVGSVRHHPGIVDATFGMPEIDRGAMGAASICCACSRCRRSARCSLPQSRFPRPKRTGWARLEAGGHEGRAAYQRARRGSRNRSREEPESGRLAKEIAHGIEPVDVKKKLLRVRTRLSRSSSTTSPDSQEAATRSVEKRTAQFEGGKPKTK